MIFTKVTSVDKIELIYMAVVFFFLFLLSSVVFCKLSSKVGRESGNHYLYMYMNIKNKKQKKNTRLKSQFSLKIVFIERKTLDVDWDFCDFHKY